MVKTVIWCYNANWKLNWKCFCTHCHGHTLDLPAGDMIWMIGNYVTCLILLEYLMLHFWYCFIYVWYNTSDTVWNVWCDMFDAVSYVWCDMFDTVWNIWYDMFDTVWYVRCDMFDTASYVWCDMFDTVSMHRTDKYSQHSSVIWPVWLNGWVFVYELSGCGFGSSCLILFEIFDAICSILFEIFDAICLILFKIFDVIFLILFKIFDAICFVGNE